MKTKVYVASKLHHNRMWIDLAEKWKDKVEFTARWPTKHVGITPDTPQFARMFWIEDEEDVFRSDCVMLYGAPGDHLRGGLVEAGMAIAFGKKVIVVGEHPDYGTWQYHPSVHRVQDFDEALKLMLEWETSHKSSD